eukprot:5223668-Pyramimonas_sp.AAC.1
MTKAPARAYLLKFSEKLGCHTTSKRTSAPSRVNSRCATSCAFKPARPGREDSSTQSVKLEGIGDER